MMLQHAGHPEESFIEHEKGLNKMSPARVEEVNTSIKHNYNNTAAITADVF